MRLWILENEGIWVKKISENPERVRDANQNLSGAYSSVKAITSVLRL